MISKFFTPVIFVVLLTLSGCSLDDPSTPMPVGPEPEPWYVLSRDSIAAGEYLGIGIGGSGEAVYEAVRALRQTKGVNYLNMVSNQTSDIYSLENRIPLYSYILLDEEKGTDSGVQITLTQGVVSAIYLNSGKQISRWPEKGNTSVREGDKGEEVYGKLVAISKNRSYANKFERISLLTKDLSKPFDPITAHLPQWYFAYLTEEEHLEIIEIHLKAGKAHHLIVTRQTKDWREVGE